MFGGKPVAGLYVSDSNEPCLRYDVQRLKVVSPLPPLEMRATGTKIHVRSREREILIHPFCWKPNPENIYIFIYIYLDKYNAARYYRNVSKIISTRNELLVSVKKKREKKTQLRYKLYEAINCLAGKTLDISTPSFSPSLSPSLPPHIPALVDIFDLRADRRELSFAFPSFRSDSNRNDIEEGGRW